MINIQILNSPDELKSFPVTQSITLKSNVRLDETTLGDHIILFRLLPEKGLISLADPYNYSLGYIKEKFSTIDLSFKQEEFENYFLITVKPKIALNLDSDYVIYLTTSLFNSKVNILKSGSKSNSSISAQLKPTTKAGDKSLVSIKTTSRLTDNSNLTVVSIDGEDKTLNLKVDRRLSTLFFEIELEDIVYVAGETFRIEALPDTEAQDVMYQFRTTSSTSIKPLETQQPSSSIDTQQILNFYKKASAIPKAQVAVPKYLGTNLFSITLPEGYHLNLDKALTMSIKEAFGNYLLQNLGIYENKNYRLYIEEEGNELFIEVVYKEEGSNDVVDYDEKPLKFKERRSR